MRLHRRDPNTRLPGPTVTAAPIRSSSHQVETGIGVRLVAGEVTDGVQTGPAAADRSLTAGSPITRCDEKAGLLQEYTVRFDGGFHRRGLDAG